MRWESAGCRRWLILTPDVEVVIVGAGCQFKLVPGRCAAERRTQIFQLDVAQSSAGNTQSSLVLQPSDLPQNPLHNFVVLALALRGYSAQFDGLELLVA